MSWLRKKKRTARAPKVRVAERGPHSLEIARGWVDDRVVDSANDDEVLFDDLLADCHAWCAKYGYPTPHFTVVGKALALRYRSRSHTTRRTWVSGARLR